MSAQSEDVLALRQETLRDVGAVAVSPADLGSLLLAVDEHLEQYVRFAFDAQALAVTLWIAHAHAIAAAEVTPYIAATSPEKRAGKTRQQEACETLLPEPIRASDISPAALFRALHR